MNKAAAYSDIQRDRGESLVREYLPLVKKIGLHMIARLPPDVELDDLLQVGLIALLQAAEGYDSSRGAAFTTYAGIRIKGAMIDEIRRNDWTPRSVQQKMRRLADAIAAVDARLGRAATEAEIADELELPLDEYQQLAAEIATAKLSSLDELLDEPADDSGNADPLSQLDDNAFRRALGEAIERLPEKEKLMMSLYYVEELNLKEIGAVLGVGESRVSQLHGQALARLRSLLADWVANQ